MHALICTSEANTRTERYNLSILYIILTYLFVQVKMVGYNQFIASAGSLLVWISFISYHAIPTFRPLFRFFIDISMLIHLRVHVWGVLSVLKGNTACKMVHPVDWLTPALSEWDQITVNTKVKSLVFLLVFSFTASLKSWCKIHVFTTITKLFRDLPLSWKFDLSSWRIQYTLKNWLRTNRQMNEE